MDLLHDVEGEYTDDSAFDDELRLAKVLLAEAGSS